MYGRQSFFSGIPQAVKGLLIINAGMFLITELLIITNNIDLKRMLGLYYFDSKMFQPYQIVTHMFMHGNFMHLFFNMYALWLFGQVIERVWGPKKFVIYYFITGFGALILHSLVKYFEYRSLISGLPPDAIEYIKTEGMNVLASGKNYTDSTLGELNIFLNYSYTVGASGAVMGLLIAFGMLFPNIELQIIFIPIPIKAKYFVIGYAVIEMIWGISNIPGDNIAHFAHLGGMLFGFILVKIWGKSKGPKSHFYKEY